MSELTCLRCGDELTGWARCENCYLEAFNLKAERDKLKAENEKYAAFFDAYKDADSNRGCFSCSPAHDCRCELDRKISDTCTCGRAELEKAEAELDDALDSTGKTEGEGKSDGV